MTQFKVGDKVQFNADAVHEADRIDKEEYGGTRGYAEGIILKGGLDTGGVIERSDYSDVAPFQIKLPDGRKVWAEEEWLKTPDKFRPGQVVDWVNSDGSQRANGYWDGSTIVKRCTSPIYEDYYEVRREDGDVGAMHGDQLVLHLFGDYSDDDWMDENSADSPDEAPTIIDYAPVVDEVQDDKVWASLVSLKTGGPVSMTFTVVPEVKDPNAPTVEELNQGIDITDYIKDITGFEPLPHQTEILQDMVDHPAHYGGEDDVYEVIKVIEAWGLGFHLGNAVKYIARAGVKDPETEIQDLEKSRWYIDRRIQWLKENDNV